MIAAGLGGMWRRLWDSVAFRLTFNYGLLAVCTTVFLLVFAYSKIVGLLQHQLSRQVDLTTQRLVNHYHERGPQALYAEIEQLLSDQTDIDVEMYLLLDSKGAKIIGNLDPFPPEDHVRDRAEPVLAPVMRNGMPLSGFLAVHPLENGMVLVVGRDIDDLNEIKRLVGQAIVAAMVMALLLVLIGTFIFRRELRKRIEGIRDTALHVGTGELTRRIPPAPEEDEFAHLRHDINHMLDQIETLMKGVRNVSDSMAHNLRTPLTHVLARLHKAQRQAHDRTALSAAIDSASEEIHSLIAVTEKLLLIAEAESGVRRQIFDRISVGELISDVVELYEPLAETNGISLRMGRERRSFLPREGPWVLGDADLLAGAVANLVDNAIKYAGSGGRIRVATWTRGNKVTISVQDDGAGVPPCHLARLGTRFHRLHPDIPGSGLGLASVRAIVGLHGGTVTFYSYRGFEARVELQSLPNDNNPVMIR